MAAAPHAVLLSLSVEAYGRWGADSLRLVRELARAKAANYPEILQLSVRHAYAKRWWHILSVAVQRLTSDAILRSHGADLIDASSSSQVFPLADVLDLFR